MTATTLVPNLSDLSKRWRAVWVLALLLELVLLVIPLIYYAIPLVLFLVFGFVTKSSIYDSLPLQAWIALCAILVPIAAHAGGRMLLRRSGVATLALDGRWILSAPFPSWTLKMALAVAVLVLTLLLLPPSEVLLVPVVVISVIVPFGFLSIFVARFFRDFDNLHELTFTDQAMTLREAATGKLLPFRVVAIDRRRNLLKLNIKGRTVLCQSFADVSDLKGILTREPPGAAV